MGQRVRVSLRIGWQGKYGVQDVITMGTPVRGQKVPHRRGINYYKEAWVWEGETWPCPCLSDSMSFSRSVRSLPIVIHVTCPWAIVYSPISYPPCLNPPSLLSTSPPHGTTSCNACTAKFGV